MRKDAKMAYKDHRPKGGNPYLRTTEDWRALAKKSHLCVSCIHSQPEIWDRVCPKCGAENSREYMPSAAELRRAVQLIRQYASGKITGLEFHPRYDLKVNGVKICAYEADAIYTENGQFVVEDTKASGNFIEPVAKLKIKLFNALFSCQGMSVKIHRDG